MIADSGPVWGAIRPAIVAEIAEDRNPIGVSAYRLTQRLPERLKGSLPTVEQLEAELGGASKTGGDQG